MHLTSITVALSLLAIGHAANADVQSPVLSFAPYVFETEHHGAIDAEKAYLSVPVLHQMPQGRRFDLRVVRLKARHPNGEPPVVYLAGGPGGSGVGTARGRRWPVFDAVRQNVDVLLFDQRGTGESSPPPVCTHKIEPQWQQPTQEADALREVRTTIAACIDEWRAGGVALEAYTTVESAADLAQLRAALGVEQLQLWGMSYGTHLSLAALRLYPKDFKRAVLMGVEGPDHTLKLPLAADALMKTLAAAAAPAFPQLWDDTEAVLQRLEQQSQSARSWMLGGTEVHISAFDAKLAVAAMLGRSDTQALLPLAMQQARAGDYGLLVDLVVAVRQQRTHWHAMPLVMDYASGATPARRARVAAEKAKSILGDALNFPWSELTDLPLPDLGDEFRTPVVLQQPLLLISGTHDGRTPVANASELLPLLPNAEHLVLGGAAHDDDLWLTHDQIAPRIAAFFSGQDAVSETLPVRTPRLPQSTADVLLDLFGIKAWQAATAIGLTLIALWLTIRWLLARWRRHRKTRAPA